MAKYNQEIITVSSLKTLLLSVIRDVEHGKCFGVTKSGKLVAHIIPAQSQDMPAVGFCTSLEIIGDIESPLSDDWAIERNNI